MELIERLIRSGGSAELEDAFALVRELESEGSYIGYAKDETGEKKFYDEGNFALAHKYSREVRSGCAKLIKEKGWEDMLDLYKRTLLFDAPWDFDCAFRYAEWERPINKRFYEPRRKQLLPAARALQRLEERKIHHLLMMMPPGTGKTTLALGFLVWSGMRHPEMSNLGVSNNNGFLRGAYDEVERMLDPKGEYLWAEIFPDVFISNTYAKDMRIDLVTRKRFQTFQFGSIETRLAGRFRATNILYCDDLVGNLEQAMNIDQMVKLWNTFTTDVRQRGIGDYGELIIQTPWSLHDPIDKLETLLEGDEDAEIIKFPALDENDESNFDYPYGLGYTTEQFHAQRELMDSISWNSLYMMQPAEREGQLYDPEELKRFFELPDAEPDLVFAVCDTKETGPDYCAMPIVYKYGEEYYIDEWICDNGNPDLTEKRIAQMLVDRKVKLARFESNRGGTLFARNVQDLVREKGGHTKITTKWNQTNKETRILAASPWVKEHCVFKDPTAYTKEYRTAMNMLCSYNMTGKNKHDDVPDVLADLEAFVENMGVATVSVARRLF